MVLNLDATEKLYADFQLAVSNPGGHSSEPVADNAIYSSGAGLNRFAAYEFPFELNAVTRAYYERRAALETGQRAADMRAILKEPPDPQAIRRLIQNAPDGWITHTTCVPTRLEAGHANNALPQRAEAVFNCRILPGHSPEEVRQRLIAVLANPQIQVRYIAADGKVLATAPRRPARCHPRARAAARTSRTAAADRAGNMAADCGHPVHVARGIRRGVLDGRRRAHLYLRGGHLRSGRFQGTRSQRAPRGGCVLQRERAYEPLSAGNHRPLSAPPTAAAVGRSARAGAPQEVRREIASAAMSTMAMLSTHHRS